MSVPARAIAAAGPAAYLRPVSPTRFLRFLTILALVWSPLAMFGAAPAPARHSAMAADGHGTALHETAARSDCPDMDGKSKDRPCGSGDCLTACAGVPAIPAASGQLEPHDPAHGPLHSLAPVSVPHGLVPEAATPPPRGFPRT